MDVQLELGLSSDNPRKIRKSVQLLRVDGDTLANAWPHAEQLLAPQWDRFEDRLDLDDLYEIIKEGKMQLWLANDKDEFFLAMVTEFVKFPKAIVFRFSWIGGRDFKDCLLFVSQLETFATDNGATHAELVGRPGWGEWMTPFGYSNKTGCYMLSKRLDTTSDRGN